MNSFLQAFAFVLPSGTKEISINPNIASNANIVLLPISQNKLIKKISCFFSFQTTGGTFNNFLNFYDVRLQGLNRDGSLITQNAGIINNPISGDWGNIFVKDRFLDFVLSSKKNLIEFNPGILLGGIKPLTVSMIFQNNLVSQTTVRININIQYE